MALITKLLVSSKELEPGYIMRALQACPTWRYRAMFLFHVTVMACTHRPPAIQACIELLIGAIRMGKWGAAAETLHPLGA